MRLHIEFTDDELRDILTTAQESGSGYWCISDDDLADALTGPGVRIRDRENPDEVLGLLTRELLAQAGGKLHTQIRADLVAQFLDRDGPNGVDADAADAFLQVALFGEVRFG
jgi:hypothetical protein